MTGRDNYLPLMRTANKASLQCHSGHKSQCTLRNGSINLKTVTVYLVMTAPYIQLHIIFKVIWYKRIKLRLHENQTYNHNTTNYQTLISP